MKVEWTMKSDIKKNQRGSGILMHISSLPGEFGIGTFGKEAYDFVDFLESAGQKYWQILPLGPTGYGDSPYQTFSSFAGNPYFICLDLLRRKGLLKEAEYKHVNYGRNKKRLDYQKISKNKMAILRLAYKRSKRCEINDLQEFQKENKYWLLDYALFMSLKTKFNNKPWFKWDTNLKQRDKKTLKEYRGELEDEINFWVFIQYNFFEQWKNLKEYSNDKGIKIIGDIPIYTAYDSADTWTHSDIFLLDKNMIPKCVSGCPPDSFSRTGQLWGNPIYNWEFLEKSNYDWWMRRIETSKNLYDIVRFDHFRGFESFWEVPYGEHTSVNGRWVKGPGIKFFNQVKKDFQDIHIIAEDLGFLTPEVNELLDQTGFPGMKVLLFAFDNRRKGTYLPHNYRENCAAYTGTHDNETVIGWLKTTRKSYKAYAIKYLKLSRREGYHWGFIRSVWSSPANIAIAPMQDCLGLGVSARMNTPSTLGLNWRWRVTKEQMTDKLVKKMYEITDLYERL